MDVAVEWMDESMLQLKVSRLVCLEREGKSSRSTIQHRGLDMQRLHFITDIQLTKQVFNVRGMKTPSRKASSVHAARLAVLFAG